jgi:hypothetical protein
VLHHLLGDENTFFHILTLKLHYFLKGWESNMQPKDKNYSLLKVSDLTQWHMHKYWVTCSLFQFSVGYQAFNTF